jgi:two-component system, response regulator PdtaR
MSGMAVAPLPIALIVEDEPIIRLDAASIAKDAGFEPIVAENADEAIAILESRTDIRVVFTDIEMPGSMDGLKLAMAIRRRWPPIAIIVTSGRRTVDTNELPTQGRFFPKPYDADGIGRALGECARSFG